MLKEKFLGSKVPWPILIVCVGTVISIMVNFIILGSKGYPYDTFLFRPVDRFMDFHHFWEQCRDLNPYLSVPATPFRPYFPFAYFFNHLFVFDSLVWSHVFYFTLSSLGIIYFSKKILERLHGIGDSLSSIIMMVLFSYPFIFVVDRGNPEIIMLPIMLCFIYHYLWGNRKTALISIAFCISMKLTPALFGFLYLKDKKYKDFFLLIGLTLILTILSLYLFSYLNPGTTMMDHLNRMVLNQKLFTDHYGKTTEGMSFSHSLFSGIKYFVLWNESPKSLSIIEKILPLYTLMTLFSAIGLGLWIILKKSSSRVAISLIISLMLLLPHMSADYKLLHILTLAVLWFWDDSRQDRNLFFMKISIALLLIPKAYFFHRSFAEANVGVLINPILIIGLMCLLIHSERNNQV